MATILALTLATAFAPAYVHAFQHVGGAFGSMPSMRVTTPRLTMLSTGLKGNGLVLRSAGIPPLLSPGSVLRSPLRVPITHSKDRFGADVTVKTGTLVTGDNNKPKVNNLLLGLGDAGTPLVVQRIDFKIRRRRESNVITVPRSAELENLNFTRSALRHLGRPGAGLP